jgi:hypothetical protein
LFAVIHFIDNQSLFICVGSNSLWIGDDFAGEQTFKGRSTVTNQLEIPMAHIMSAESTPSGSIAAATGAKMLAIQKDGTKGRLYYRIGLNYAPTSLQLLPVNYGFKVERRYTGVDDAKHVTRDAVGNWHFKLGEKIKVELTMATTSRRYHVALCDYLPAGLEPLNPELKGTILAGSTSSVDRSRGHNPWTYVTTPSTSTADRSLFVSITELIGCVLLV